MDFGLTVAQFSILAVWRPRLLWPKSRPAPLRTSSDKQKLLVFASLTMIVEVAIISFIRTTNRSLSLLFFSGEPDIERIPGSAAIAGLMKRLPMTPLAEKGMRDQWGNVLALVRFQSIGFILAMSVERCLRPPSDEHRVSLFKADIHIAGYDHAVSLVPDADSRGIGRCHHPNWKISNGSGNGHSGKGRPVKEAFGLTLKQGGGLFKQSLSLPLSFSAHV
ncbi:MAG: hypothetical protein R2860_02750 [Desulfobacterales bacterium]